VLGFPLQILSAAISGLNGEEASLASHFGRASEVDGIIGKKLVVISFLATHNGLQNKDGKC